MTLDYGNYGIFLIMGNAALISLTVGVKAEGVIGFIGVEDLRRSG